MARARRDEAGGLEAYRAKRDFSRTTEPPPKQGRAAATRAAAAPGYVIQKHAATRLHYDLRLSIDGAYKSWAVTKGPSLDPADKRLAVHVEDHPLDYGGFEGVIPKGEYGGGTVMIWDRGAFSAEGDAANAYAEGKLKLAFDGERLKGGWTLVRMGGRAAREKGKDNWLLIKEADETAAPGEGDRLLEESLTSVATGRTMEEIAAAEPPRSDMPDLPAFVPPQLAQSVEAPPSGQRWLHEIKHDGYRLLARRGAAGARLFTRSGQDWTERFPRLAEALGRLMPAGTLMDGEALVLEEDGRSRFGRLQEALKAGDDRPISFVAFDLLFLRGEDIRETPLEERKQALAKLIGGGDGPVRYGDHLDEDAETVYRHACRLRLEGLVSKRRDRPYRSGRSPDWRKSKCRNAAEFVIGGWTAPKKGGAGIGSLLVGVMEGDELVYAGKVGTGFTGAESRRLRAMLEACASDRNPFIKLTPDGRRGARFARPELVCQVEYLELTREGMLRHAAYQGLREDKPAAEVGREPPARPSPGSRVMAGGKVAGVALSNPDKVLFGPDGPTKADLALYYETIAEQILPQVVNRPLSLVRCPAGSDKPCFYQRHSRAGLPPSVRELKDDEGGEGYLAIDDLSGLIGLVQMGVLELHPWGARADRPDRPDRLILDFDPDPAVEWPQVIEAAREMRERLEALGLESFVKTTGGKGLHVTAPLSRRHGWPEVKAFARALSEAAAADAPDRYVATQSKKARKGKIYIDYLRNDHTATAVAAYSTRARAGAPVAMPVAWEELDGLKGADVFTLANAPEHIRRRRADPWAEMDGLRQSITVRARKALGLT